MAQDPPAQDQMHYEAMAQEALRGVVKAALKRAAAPEGLPGAHHFYITFKTRMPGVQIPKHLVERFPDEMTIVIQHRFWDLKVSKESFSVGLSFGGVPSTLVVPFAARGMLCAPAIADKDSVSRASSARSISRPFDGSSVDSVKRSAAVEYRAARALKFSCDS